MDDGDSRLTEIQAGGHEREEDDGEPQFVVHGTVRHPDGSPAPKLVVRAFNRNLRSEDLLGQSWTGENGAYRIEYSARAFAASGETDSADLIVRAYSPNPTTAAVPAPLAESPTLFNAPADSTIDLVIGNSDLRGPAEFDLILRAIRPHLQGVAITDLTEDDTHHDLSFLAGETGYDLDPGHAGQDSPLRPPVAGPRRRLLRDDPGGPARRPARPAQGQS
jgi:hypothetical protein